jgi:hypothetical protein
VFCCLHRTAAAQYSATQSNRASAPAITFCTLQVTACADHCASRTSRSWCSWCQPWNPSVQQLVVLHTRHVLSCHSFTGTTPLTSLSLSIACKQACRCSDVLCCAVLACRFVWGKKIERDLLRGTDVREFTAAAQQRKHEERMVRAMSLPKVAHANSSSTSWAHALHAVPLFKRVCTAGVQHGGWQLQGHAAGFPTATTMLVPASSWLARR